LPYRLCGCVTYRRAEIDKVPSITTLRKARPKREPQKIKALVSIATVSIAIFTEDNFCLLHIQFQPTFSQPTSDSIQQVFGLLFTYTMANHIIGIAFKRYFRKMPLHPLVQCIVQKQIGKQWTDHTSLRDPFPPVFQRAVGHLNWGFEPPLNVQQHPFTICVLPHSTHQKLMINRIEEASDIKIKHPMIFPAPLPGLSDSL
jgi:hypothetical protein